MIPLHDLLNDLGACKPAIEWSAPFGTDHCAAWNACTNGEWMAWLLETIGHQSDAPIKEWNAYLDAIAPFVEVYDAATSVERKAFETVANAAFAKNDEIRDALWQTYLIEKDSNPKAWATMEEARKQAWNDYKIATIAAQDLFDLATLSASQSLNAAVAPHQKVFADAIRQSITFEQAAQWLAERIQNEMP
jgi:hypothetical protein